MARMAITIHPASKHTYITTKVPSFRLTTQPKMFYRTATSESPISTDFRHEQKSAKTDGQALTMATIIGIGSTCTQIRMTIPYNPIITYFIMIYLSNTSTNGFCGILFIFLCVLQLALCHHDLCSNAVRSLDMFQGSLQYLICYYLMNVC